jgi:hypothetical protein
MGKPINRSAWAMHAANPMQYGWSWFFFSRLTLL